MQKLIHSVLIMIGAGLTACSSFSVQKEEYQLIPVTELPEQTTLLEQEIKPYRDSVEWEMNEVIAHADTSFIPERPCGNLNNWVADAVFTNQTKTVRLNTPILCLLNTGSLRTTFNKGNVTIGDVFKVMPFDNTVVWATFSIDILPEIANYLVGSGGEPIAGAKLLNGKIVLNSTPPNASEVIIITSDYLVSGGDKMTFFKKAKNLNYTGKLLRDCLIEEARQQGTLVSNPENRMIIK